MFFRFSHRIKLNDQTHESKVLSKFALHSHHDGIWCSRSSKNRLKMRNMNNNNNNNNTTQKVRSSYEKVRTLTFCSISGTLSTLRLTSLFLKTKTITDLIDLSRSRAKCSHIEIKILTYHEQLRWKPSWNPLMERSGMRSRPSALRIGSDADANYYSPRDRNIP